MNGLHELGWSALHIAAVNCRYILSDSYRSDSSQVFSAVVIGQTKVSQLVGVFCSGQRGNKGWSAGRCIL